MSQPQPAEEQGIFEAWTGLKSLVVMILNNPDSTEQVVYEKCYPQIMQICREVGGCIWLLRQLEVLTQDWCDERSKVMLQSLATSHPNPRNSWPFIQTFHGQWDGLTKSSQFLGSVFLYFQTTFCQQFDFTIESMNRGIFADLVWQHPVVQTALPRVRQYLSAAQAKYMNAFLSELKWARNAWSKAQMEIDRYILDLREYEDGFDSGDAEDDYSDEPEDEEDEDDWTDGSSEEDPCCTAAERNPHCPRCVSHQPSAAYRTMRDRLRMRLNDAKAQQQYQQPARPNIKGNTDTRSVEELLAFINQDQKKKTKKKKKPKKKAAPKGNQQHQNGTSKPSTQQQPKQQPKQQQQVTGQAEQSSQSAGLTDPQGQGQLRERDSRPLKEKLKGFNDFPHFWTEEEAGDDDEIAEFARRLENISPPPARKIQLNPTTQNRLRELLKTK